MRIPLLETVDSMDLTNMLIELRVQGAYSKGGIPLNVHGIANVKIAGEQPVLANAIERFLGVDASSIMAVARETLEGNLRGVLATLTPEEVNQDTRSSRSRCSPRRRTICAARPRARHAEDPGRLRRQGLPRQHRPPAVGRGAEELAHRRGREPRPSAPCVGREPARDRAVEDRGRRSPRRAPTTRAASPTRRRAAAALVAEAQGQVASQLARAEGELEVQKARIEQVKRQLAADVLEPARASKAAAEANAKGAAAMIVEQGRATASAMGQIAATWREVGPAARSVFLMQKVADLTRIVMSTVGSLKVDRLTVLGGVGGAGGGNGSGTGLPDLTGKLIAASEQIKAATGIDIAAALRARTPPTTPG